MSPLRGAVPTENLDDEGSHRAALAHSVAVFAR
jgi:hypothetical protein